MWNLILVNCGNATNLWKTNSKRVNWNSIHVTKKSIVNSIEILFMYGNIFTANMFISVNKYNSVLAYDFTSNISWEKWF